jgi:group II intron reverse transcriptase/maturase
MARAMNQVPNKEQKLPRLNTSAFKELCRVSFLDDAWRQVNKSNKKSSGVDGVTIGQFANNREPNLRLLAEEIRSGSFEFHKLSGIAIPKDESKRDGAKRPLRIPAVRDRVVLKALQLFLRPRLEPLNAPFSYAYRKEGGAQRAIAHARALAKNFKFVVEADIQSYFDRVDKKSLATVLFRLQHLTSLQPLIEEGLSLETEISPTVADGDRDLFLENDERGIPQGSALSPILANLYLAHFDLEMERLGWNTLRYADDIIMFTSSRAQAETAFAAAKNTLTSLGLDMHPLSEGPKAKSKIRDIKSEGVEFVGFKIESDRVLPSSKTIQKFRDSIATATEMKDGRFVNHARQTKKSESLIARATSVISKVNSKAASLAPCDECQEIVQLGEVVKGFYLRMFEEIGITVGPDDAAKRRLLDVPDLLGVWKEQREKYSAKTKEPPAARAEIAAWRGKVEKRIARAFDGVVAVPQQHSALLPEPEPLVV